MVPRVKPLPLAAVHLASLLLAVNEPRFAGGGMTHRLPPAHSCASSNARSPASSSTLMPSLRALSSLLPGSAPATT